MLYNDLLFSDVLHAMDKWCSGKHSCRVAVRDFIMERTENSCPFELRSYLQARYTCLPGKDLVKVWSQHISLHSSIAEINNFCNNKVYLYTFSCQSRRALLSIRRRSHTHRRF